MHINIELLIVLAATFGRSRVPLSTFLNYYTVNRRFISILNQSHEWQLVPSSAEYRVRDLPVCTSVQCGKYKDFYAAVYI